MSQADFWYVRFPDGRILRAANTLIVRQELGSGHIPLNSTVRRSPTEEWVALGWMQEFADVVEQLSTRSVAPTPRSSPPATPPPGSRRLLGSSVGSRSDLGVSGYLRELLAALDSTLIDKKMALAVASGLILGFVLALSQAGGFARDGGWLVSAWCLAGAAAITLDLLTVLLMKLTYVELSRLRPARWREGLAGIGRTTFRLLLTQAIVGGTAGGLIVLIRGTPSRLMAGSEIAAGMMLAVGMVLEVVLWPLFAFWWQMPPILVVEGVSLGRGLGQWLNLLRRHLGRVLLFQAMALGLGLLITAPFVLPIVPLFLPTFHPPQPLANVADGTRCLLLGLACAPLFAYWTVANVFIYLSLHYGSVRR